MPHSVIVAMIIPRKVAGKASNLAIFGPFVEIEKGMPNVTDLFHNVVVGVPQTRRRHP
jgi:hypothetical protein